MRPARSARFDRTLSMEKGAEWSALLAGRWQIPAALAALLICGFVLTQLKPAPRPVDFEAALADLTALREAQRFRDAADAAANLLETTPPLPHEQKARLHDFLSDVVYRQELLRLEPIRANSRLVIEHALAALAHGREPSAELDLRMARAYEWLEEPGHAIRAYRQTLERQATTPQRRAALLALVYLLEGRPSAEEERRRLIGELLAEEGVSPAYLWGGVRSAMQEAFDRNDTAAAAEVLAQYGEQFRRSDLKGYHDYLHAWLLVSEGRHLEAEPLLNEVDHWLEEGHLPDAELAQSGYLPSLSVALRGRIHLLEYRPQAALELFESVGWMDRTGEGYVLAAVGRAEALAQLERHETARELIRETIQKLGRGTASAAAGYPRIRRTMRGLFDQRLALGDYRNALGYLSLALRVTPTDEKELHLKLRERLAEVGREAAPTFDDPQQQRAAHGEAGAHFEQAAELAAEQLDHSADLLWLGIQEYDLAGQIQDSRRLLHKFIAQRAGDPRIPGAMLRLAQTFDADGRPDDAIRWYDRLINDFPKLEEAARARLLRARLLIRLGGERLAEAERALSALLETDTLGPDARVFRDALFLLGELLYEQSRFAAAIRRLEDFLVLYSDDPERFRARFLLANAYRRSAYELRDRAAEQIPQAQVREESRRRFLHAAELFERLVAEFGAQPEGDLLAPRYERLALLYRGDCLYELKDAQRLAEALAAYRQAAARYQHEPTALAAQVQVANIHLMLGQLAEAARAVENARWLLRGIPDEAFAGELGGRGRDSWEQYLSAVASSHLLRDASLEAR
jgi:tetratricopeptide (TPR) repeat protein